MIKGYTLYAKDFFVLKKIKNKFLSFYIISIILASLASLGAAVGPLVIGVIIDNITHKNFENIYLLIFILGMIQLLVGLMKNISSRVSAIKAEEISHELRSLLMETIFHDDKNHNRVTGISRGKVLSLFSRDVESTWDLFGFALVELVSSVVVIISLSIIVFALSVKTGILFLIMTIVFCLFFYDNGKRIRLNFSKAAPKFDRMISLINALLDGYETVAAFHRQFWARNVTLKVSKNVTRLANAAHSRATTFTFITGALNTLGIIAVWVMNIPSGNSVSEDQLSIGELVTILFYFNMIIDPLESISNAAKAFSKGAISLNRLSEFIRKNEINIENNLQENRTHKFNAHILNFENVSDLLVDGNMSILQPMSLQINEEDIIGIAGLSGSGKSTLLRVIARLIPSDGNIQLLENQLFHSIAEEDFRKKVVYIPQSPAIFPFSLQENVFMENYSSFLNVLNKVGLKDRANELVDCTDIFNSGLSGGETQRLAVSRVLSTNFRLILIDEPTSALDFNNSIKVRDAIINHVFSSSGAAIIASHDPIVLERCSRIILLKGGRTVEEGTFEELKTTSEYFNVIVNRGNQ